MKALRKVRMIGVATGMVLALIMISRGWLLQGHDIRQVPATRTFEPWRGEPRPAVPANPPRLRLTPDDFPLVPGGSDSVTNPPVPAPPATLPAPTTARIASPRAESAAPAPPSTSNVRPEAEEHYVVQVGTYRLEKNARQDQARYHALGIDCRLSQSGPYLVLRLPLFDSLEDAKRAEQKLRARGIQPVLLGPR